MDIDVMVVILMLNKACMKGINQLSIHKCLLRAGQYFVIGSEKRHIRRELYK